MSRFVFFDSRLGDLDLLVAGLAPDALAIILDPLQDGVEQIATALAGKHDIDAIDIISHGADGVLYLGGTSLSRENLARYSAQLEAIGAALCASGDILLYGCDVASTQYGRQFIDALASYTGADVAASTDATGAAALGGNWVLEAETGLIEAGAVFTSDGMSAWSQLLAVPSISGVAPLAAYTEQAAAIVLSPGLTVSDADGTLAGATVRLVGVQPGDVLAATLAGTAITAGYNAANGTLVLTGSDTVAHYQQVLRSVTFSSTSDNPTNRGLDAVRTVDWHVNDGSATVGPLFGAQTTFGAGTTPNAIAMADLNSDGRLDLAVANGGDVNGVGASVSVLLGNGNGTFAATANIPAGIDARAVAIADLNGDGKLDLAVANYLGFGVSVMLGAGNGTFALPATIATGMTPISVAAADVNGDGKLDLVTANAGYNNVSVLLGNGDGTYAAAINFAAGLTPRAVAIADLNSDGKLDFAVANAGDVLGSSGSVSVLLGNGNGTFGAATNFFAGTGVSSIATGDLNGDGNLDLATGSFTNISVLFGNGAGNFSSASSFAAGLNPLFVTVADVSGDGKLDLLSSNYFAQSALVLLGNGNGTFSAVSTFATGNFPVSVAAGDLNGDGKYDLATANGGANNVSVLLNAGTHFGAAPSTKLAVTSVNDSPTFTLLSAPVATIGAGKQATITFENLKALGNEADVDGVVSAFVVQTVSSGTLLIGASAGAAAPWAAGSNDIIDATHRAYWTGAANTTGTLNAFTVTVKDNGALESGIPAVQATVQARLPIVFNWSALSNGQTITTFLPDTDVLHFDDAGISAAGVTIEADDTAAVPYTSFVYGGKTVTFNMTPFAIATSNVTFANGSVILVGDNTSSVEHENDGYSLAGSAAGDLLAGGGGADSLSGGDGNDVFIVPGSSKSGKVFGNDTIDGGNGNDLLQFGSTFAAINVNLALGSATTGDGPPASTFLLSNIENVVGSQNGDVITGNTGANRLEGAAGNDTLSGGNGNDTLAGGAGNDSIDGGSGSDTADYGSAAAGVTVQIYNNQTSNDGQGGVDTLISIENAIGSAFNDVLYGDNNNNVFRGGAGNDQFYAGAGSDTADFSSATTGVAADLAAFYAIDGQGGFDYLVDIENLTGSAFDDYLSGNAADNTFRGGAGNDIFVGLAGRDTLDLSSAAAGTAVDLAAQYAIDGQGGVDYMQDVENITGSAFGDYLSGNASDNVFNGGAGSDIFVGLSGNDTADYSSGLAGAIVDLAGQYGVDGLGGTDFLVSIENVIGSAFNDYLSGSNADNTFRGGAGSDTFVGGIGVDKVDYSAATAAATVNLAGLFALDGQGGNDFIVGVENIAGSAFADTLVGDANANRIEGAAGNDFIAGNSGADNFAFGTGSGLDTVTDFSKAQGDKINLQGNLNGSGITTGAQALAHTFDFGGNAIVDLVGGNSITLLGVTTASLSASDFVIF